MTKKSGSGIRHQFRVGCRWTRHPRTVYLFIISSALSLPITDMSSSVKLYVYDLSNGMVKAMSMQVVGRQIDGIW
jgi:hypothetical protein